MKTLLEAQMLQHTISFCFLFNGLSNSKNVNGDSVLSRNYNIFLLFHFIQEYICIVVKILFYK